MKLPKPISCRPTAFSAFAAQLPVLATNRGLLRAAIAISMHELPDVDLLDAEQEVLKIVSRIQSRVRNPLPNALLAHLHDELFEQMELQGNVDDYYLTTNSYIPLLMETGLGIPISLSLVYVVVARELGLRADGINSPGHFLVQVMADGPPMFVDPFYDGMLLVREDAFQRIAMALGRDVLHADEHLRLATHQQWIARMLHNLANVFAADGRPDDVAAMTEMMNLLHQSLF